MARSCTVCSNARRADIERSLMSGGAIRAVAAQFKVTHASLQRHAQKCVPKVLEKANHSREIRLADRLMQEVESLHKTSQDLMKQAFEAKDLRTAIAAIREVRGNLEFVARMTGQNEPKKQEQGVTGLTWEQFMEMTGGKER